MILVWAGRLPSAVCPKITLKSSWWSLFISLCLFALDSPGIHADWSSPGSLGCSCFVLAGLVMPGYSLFHQAGSAWPLSGSVPTAGGSFMLPCVWKSCCGPCLRCLLVLLLLLAASFVSFHDRLCSTWVSVV